MARIAASIWFGVAVLALAMILSTSAMAQQSPAGATADIRDASGRTIATAELREDAGKVQVALLLTSPSTLTGKHGLHVMEVGRCDAPDFTSAGPIFNPLGKKHGLLASGGPMVGDLPNLTMPLQRFNAPALGASLSPGPTSLLGPNGTALVIYAGEDDGLTDPEGNAGARIACGVITNAALAGPPVAAQQTSTAVMSTPGVASLSSSQGSPSSSSSSAAPAVNLGPAVLIAVLGAALIGAGLALRKPRRS